VRIGVTGASGALAGAVVRELVARVGAGAVVAVSRTPDRVAGAGVEARRADFDRPDELARALAGLDRVVLVPSPDMRPGARRRQLEGAIDAAVHAGVDHVVLASSCGTRAAPAPHLWDSYFGPEQRLARAARRFSILRMGYFAESFLDEARPLVARGLHEATTSARVAFVARDDVAAALAGLVTSEGVHGATFVATGARAYDGPGRAAALAEAAGVPVSFRLVRPEAWLERLRASGLDEPTAGTLASLQAMWADGAYDVVTGDVERLGGRPPRAFEDVAREALAPSRGGSA
jgi:NAD(P)H dehydrogenase (quinone)